MAEVPPAGMQAKADTAAALWRSVVSRPPHPAGCTCMGHMLVPAMNARDMEADILDYMRGRYAAEGLEAIVELLDARAVARGATEIPAQPFRAWLQRLPAGATPPVALARFLDDLIATLESFEANASGATGGSKLFCV
jgi:hypothetical protein